MPKKRVRLEDKDVERIDVYSDKIIANYERLGEIAAKRDAKMAEKREVLREEVADLREQQHKIKLKNKELKAVQ